MFLTQHLPYNVKDKFYTNYLFIMKETNMNSCLVFLFPPDNIKMSLSLGMRKPANNIGVDQPAQLGHLLPC